MAITKSLLNVWANEKEIVEKYMKTINAWNSFFLFFVFGSIYWCFTAVTVSPSILLYSKHIYTHTLDESVCRCTAKINWTREWEKRNCSNELWKQRVL